MTKIIVMNCDTCHDINFGLYDTYVSSNLSILLLPVPCVKSSCLHCTVLRIRFPREELELVELFAFCACRFYSHYKHPNLMKLNIGNASHLILDTVRTSDIKASHQQYMTEQ